MGEATYGETSNALIHHHPHKCHKLLQTGHPPQDLQTPKRRLCHHPLNHQSSRKMNTLAHKAHMTNHRDHIQHLISPTPSVPSPQYGTNSAVRLLRLDLPTFSGNALEWQSFWDGFDAAVNSNQAISGVQKLNYLRSQLRDDASHVIAGFSLINASYECSVTGLMHTHVIVVTLMYVYICICMHAQLLQLLVYLRLHDMVSEMTGTVNASLSLPAPFPFSSLDLWPRWKRRFEQYRVAAGLSKELEE